MRGLISKGSELRLTVCRSKSWRGLRRWNLLGEEQMRTFKDALGNEWTIKITIGTARTLREKMAASQRFAGVDFLDYAGVFWGLDDPFFASDLIY